MQLRPRKPSQAAPKPLQPKLSVRKAATPRSDRKASRPLCATHERRSGPWHALPVEVQRHIVSFVDEPTAVSLTEVDRASRSLVRTEARWPYLQHELIAAAWHTSDDALLSVLQAHRTVFRARRSPWILFEPSEAVLAGVAQLIRGSMQRPVALFGRERPAAHWPAMPDGITAWDEGRYLYRHVASWGPPRHTPYEVWLVAPHSAFSSEEQSARKAFYARLRSLCGYLNLPFEHAVPEPYAEALRSLCTHMTPQRRASMMVFASPSYRRAQCINHARLAVGPNDAAPDVAAPAQVAYFELLRAFGVLFETPNPDVLAWRDSVLAMFRLYLNESDLQMAEVTQLIDRFTNDLAETLSQLLAA